MRRQYFGGMGLGHVQVILLMVAVGLQCVAALFDRPSFYPPPLAPAAHFYPKPSILKLPSRALEDKLYFSFSTKPRKSKYLVAKLPDGWKTVDDEQKQTHLFEEPFRRVPSLQAFNSLSKLQDDVKPVTEHIEGDLMYDFRTNTHSI